MTWPWCKFWKFVRLGLTLKGAVAKYGIVGNRYFSLGLKGLGLKGLGLKGLGLKGLGLKGLGLKGLSLKH